ncbi:hypothetical protein K466DRAFT_579944 [Polyporus arcularius HHB13444]|uniref:Uncharacterized protein n=1 Tax=Polyporus arcularius HHB13444 TaxID=1314778 RepID=A0A5C3Q7W1_9APHY|nr:hypothetical protein K466DRAFT_579944 [Polyporus arcularius HHB13444]
MHWHPLSALNIFIRVGGLLIPLSCRAILTRSRYSRTRAQGRRAGSSSALIREIARIADCKTVYAVVDISLAARHTTPGTSSRRPAIVSLEPVDKPKKRFLPPAPALGLNEMRRGRSHSTGRRLVVIDTLIVLSRV